MAGNLACAALLGQNTNNRHVCVVCALSIFCILEAIQWNPSDRWTTPDPSPVDVAHWSADMVKLFPLPPHVVNTYRWAAGFVSQFAKLTSEPSSEVCFLATMHAGYRLDDVVYMSVENNYSQRMVVQCVVGVHPNLARRHVARLALPLVFQSSADWLGSFQEGVQHRGAEAPQLLKFTMAWQYAAGTRDIFALLARKGEKAFVLKAQAKEPASTSASSSAASASASAGSGGHGSGNGSSGSGGGGAIPPPLPPPPGEPPGEPAAHADDEENDRSLEDMLEEILDAAAAGFGHSEADELFAEWCAEDNEVLSKCDAHEKRTVTALEKSATSSTSKTSRALARAERVVEALIPGKESLFASGAGASIGLDDLDYDEAVLNAVAFDEDDDASGAMHIGVGTAASACPVLLRSVSAVWQEAALKFADALQFCHARRDKPLGGNSWPLTLSMVASGLDDDAQVSLVKWSHAPARTGQKVTLDDQNRGIWPTMSTFPVVSFKTAEVVVPCTGIVIPRLKAQRVAIPPSLLHLKFSWELALSVGARMPLAPECQLCEGGMCMLFWITLSVLPFGVCVERLVVASLSRPSASSSSSG